MFTAWRVIALAAGAGALTLCLAQPAIAACQVVSATHSAATKTAALASSQELAEQSATDLKAKHRWRTVSMRAHKVKAEPFWKAVRPVVPPDAMVKPDVRTARTYSTCWRGVVVPFVCTSGSMVCGH